MKNFYRKILARHEDPLAVLYGPPSVYIPRKFVVDKKNIVFDFGGVLMQHNAEGRLQTFRQFMSDDDIANILGLTEDKSGTLAKEFEIGLCGKRWFLNRVLEHCKPGTTEKQIIDAWNLMHAGIPEGTWMKLRLLKQKGYHLYLMSNTNEIHWEHTQSLYKDLIEEYFEDVFLSFKQSCTKPSEVFFTKVDIAIHAAPKQTYFVDDMEENRSAAEKTVKWQTCADFKELMDKLK